MRPISHFGEIIASVLHAINLISKTMFHGSNLNSYILVTSTKHPTDFLKANTQGKQSSPN